MVLRHLLVGFHMNSLIKSIWKTNHLVLSWQWRRVLSCYICNLYPAVDVDAKWIPSSDKTFSHSYNAIHTRKKWRTIGISTNDVKCLRLVSRTLPCTVRSTANVVPLRVRWNTNFVQVMVVKRHIASRVHVVQPRIHDILGLKYRITRPRCPTKNPRHSRS